VLHDVDVQTGKFSTLTIMIIRRIIANFYATTILRILLHEFCKSLSKGDHKVSFGVPLSYRKFSVS